MQAVRSRAKVCKGFTLLELLVVLAIASALVAIVVPQFSGVMATLELKSSVRELASALRQARSQAIAQRHHVAVTLNVERRTYETSGVTQRHTLPSALKLKLLTAKSEIVNETVGAIRFFADGSSTGGQIKLSTDGHAHVIDVKWLTGRVSIHD
ncbi:MAG: GspH/FimT family pseudopilin [Acidiferrobacterales bacterium]